MPDKFLGNFHRMTRNTELYTLFRNYPGTPYSQIYTHSCMLTHIGHNKNHYTPEEYSP